ncbi:MAG: sodium ion-translocating decarboxylase subunit beta [Mycobacterium leprae]
MLVQLEQLWDSTALAQVTLNQALMIGVGLLLLYLALVKHFEPLLLTGIGFGAILANIPGSGILDPGGLLHHFMFLVEQEILPPLIFVGIGAMTDFSPLIANPSTFLLGAAAQLGVFLALLAASAMGFTLQESASIGIIGGADGPTAIYLTVKLAPHLLGAIAVAAYSYMSLVPLIQPPIMRLLTTQQERAVVMAQLKPVTRKQRILFPLLLLLAVGLLLPPAVPLVGMLALGNLLRESGVTERLSRTAQNELINIATILLSLTVGGTMAAEAFLTWDTLKVVGLGLFAFMGGTTGGVLFGKVMYRVTGGKVNPLIGAAGVSAVPMAARVAQIEGQRANPENFLLMHAMGPNVAGVIGTAVAAATLLAFLK